MYDVHGSWLMITKQITQMTVKINLLFFFIAMWTLPFGTTPMSVSSRFRGCREEGKLFTDDKWDCAVTL